MALAITMVVAQILAMGVAAPPASAAGPCDLTTTNRYEVCFGNGDGTFDPTIHHGIRDFIRYVRTTGTPSQNSLRIAVHSWNGAAGTTMEIIDEIGLAHAAGVDVKVLLFKSENGAQASLESKIGDARVQNCNVPGCLTKQDATHSGYMHNKLYLADVNGVPHIVQTSANNTLWDRVAYNNLLRIRGDRGLHDWLRGYFDRMWNDSWDGWDTNPERDHTGSLSGTDFARAWVFPRISPGDPVVGQLANVTGCGSGGEILISLNLWSRNRPELLDQLTRIDNQLNCDVRVVVGTKVNRDYVTEIRQTLDVEDVRIGCDVHHKIMVFDNVIYGGVLHNAVFTGSHTWGNTSLYYAAETMIRVYSDGVTTKYVNHFNDMFAQVQQDSCS